MGVPDTDRARAILRDFEIPRGIVVHSEGVARVAVAAARMVEAAGVPVDVALVEVAALLHDTRFPIGWPSVLLAVADRHVAQRFMTVDERLDDMASRHPDYAAQIGAARRPAHALEA